MLTYRDSRTCSTKPFDRPRSDDGVIRAVWLAEALSFRCDGYQLCRPGAAAADADGLLRGRRRVRLWSGDCCGFSTRPIAVLLAIYIVVIGFIGHPYWSMSGTAEADAEISFYKNISIAGGLLLLYLTGGGKYSLDEVISGDGSSA